MWVNKTINFGRGKGRKMKRAKINILVILRTIKCFRKKQGEDWDSFWSYLVLIRHYAFPKNEKATFFSFQKDPGFFRFSIRPPIMIFGFNVTTDRLFLFFKMIPVFFVFQYNPQFFFGDYIRAKAFRSRRIFPNFTHCRPIIALLFIPPIARIWKFSGVLNVALNLLVIGGLIFLNLYLQYNLTWSTWAESCWKLTLKFLQASAIYPEIFFPGY